MIVAARWDGPVAEANRGGTRGHVRRPDGPTRADRIGPTETVVVSLRVTLGPDADDGCWRVTDLVPSGLAPISASARWYEVEDEEGGVVGPTHERPWRVLGQRVDFYVSPDPKVPSQPLRYLARVVTPGPTAGSPP